MLAVFRIRELEYNMMPRREGLNAKKAWIGLPWCCMRNSFMFEKLESSTVSTNSLPGCGPNSDKIVIAASISSLSASVSVSNYLLKASVVSTSHIAVRYSLLAMSTIICLGKGYPRWRGERFKATLERFDCLRFIPMNMRNDSYFSMFRKKHIFNLWMTFIFFTLANKLLT